LGPCLTFGGGNANISGETGHKNNRKVFVYRDFVVLVTHVFSTQVFVNFAKLQAGEDDDVISRRRKASTHKRKITPLRRKK
jgi:hypothetical protein